MTAARNFILAADDSDGGSPENGFSFDAHSEPKLLQTLNLPDDLKNLDSARLRQIASEIRAVLFKLSEQRSVHFASNLGVVELAIALHSLFDFKKDRLIWDTGHQCYPHKILTGRFSEIESIRTFGGLTGYPNPNESEYDLFETGHAGCSVGAAVGLTCADDLIRPDENRRSFAVIGDGAMASGVFFEALNHAGGLRKNLTVILNDNKMSICKRVGGLGRYLDQLRMNRAYLGFKSGLHRWVDSLPAFRGSTERFMSSFKSAAKAYLTGGMLFEEFGFRYIGPVNGHDIDSLRFYLKKVREYQEPVLLHILTEKGHGFRPAELDPTTFHAPSPETVLKQEDKLYQDDFSHFQNDESLPNGDDNATLDFFSQNIENQESPESVQTARPSGNSGTPEPSEALETSDADVPDQLKSVAPSVAMDDNWELAGEHSFTHWARNAIYRAMRQDERVCVITAAMTQGNMLEPLRSDFPSRFFDVGICESHAVNFAAGLAKAGMKPVVDIYSVFLQRAYDHLFQEISLQNLPVVFLLDRSGIVGADGATHHGVFDLAYLRPFPNLTILSPGDSYDLELALPFALGANRPVCIRYPKATAERIQRSVEPIRLGKAEVLRSGKDGAIVVLGSLIADALAASDYVASAAKLNSESRIDASVFDKNKTSKPLEVGVINARFLKPLDLETILKPIRDGGFLITVEEGVLAGGFGSSVLEAANDCRLNSSRIVRLGVPDRYIPHGTRKELLDRLGLNVAGIVAAVERLTDEAGVSF